MTVESLDLLNREQLAFLKRKLVEAGPSRTGWQDRPLGEFGFGNILDPIGDCAPTALPVPDFIARLFERTVKTGLLPAAPNAAATLMLTRGSDERLDQPSFADLAAIMPLDAPLTLYRHRDDGPEEIALPERQVFSVTGDAYGGSMVEIECEKPTLAIFFFRVK